MESPGCLCPLSEDVLAVETEEMPYLREVRFGTRLCGTHPRPAGKAAAAAAKSLQSCPTLCDPIDGSPPGSRPWDSPGKNTGVGCHFLPQCMKVKSEK